MLTYAPLAGMSTVCSHMLHLQGFLYLQSPQARAARRQGSNYSKCLPTEIPPQTGTQLQAASDQLFIGGDLSMDRGRSVPK